MHPEGGLPTKIYEEWGELHRAGRNNGQPFLVGSNLGSHR